MKIFLSRNYEYIERKIDNECNSQDKGMGVKSHG